MFSLSSFELSVPCFFRKTLCFTFAKRALVTLLNIYNQKYLYILKADTALNQAHYL